MTNSTKMTYVMALDLAISCEALPIEVREKLTALRATQVKRTHDVNKPTAKQIENGGLKVAILNALEDGKGYTVSEIIATVPELADASNQKVSALVRQMKEEGTLVREDIKRKAYFTKA